MTKHRGMLFIAALAIVLGVIAPGTAFGQARPVALRNSSAAGFAPAQTCDCHSNFLQEWRQSMHAKALSDPLYKTKLDQANSATGGKIGPFCLKCHGPVATMIGQPGSTDASSAAGQGVGCTFCHQVTGPTAPTNNVSLLVDPSGVYRAQIATPTAPHPVAVSAFHNSSQFCGSCHNVSHPGNGLPVEETYSEWQGSPQAKAGVSCQDCHMSRTPGEVGSALGWDAGGGPMRKVFQMTFAGAQVGLGNPVLAKTLLQSAATLKLDQPGILEGAKTDSATVTITNVGAGHDLPTGLTEVRQMWLEVSFVAPDGTVTELGKHTYGTVLKDASGKYPAELWEATGVQSDDRIPAGGTSVNSYKIVLPGGVTAGTIRAQLLYQSAPDALAKQADAENPVTVMAEDSQPVYTTIAAERKANGAVLNEAAGSPLMPLVFAILGLVVCFALIIYFVWRGRGKKTASPKPPVTPPSASPASSSGSEGTSELGAESGAESAAEATPAGESAVEELAPEAAPEATPEQTGPEQRGW